MAAFSDKPADHVDGIEVKTAGQAVTADSLVIPIASIPELTAAEADPQTGDIRKLLFALADLIHVTVKAAPWQGADTRPANFLSYMSPSVSADTGLITRTYQQAVILTAAVEVKDEA